jgi:hypothetical protein
MQLITQVKLSPNTQRLLMNFGEELKPAVIAGMELTMAAAEAETVQHTPTDQGTLSASVYGRVVDLWPVIEGHLGSPLPYALPVELGSKPHWPPRAPIQAWVHRKFGLSGKEMISVAFLVARAISRRGTRAHHMFQQGYDLAQRLAPRFVGAAVERVAKTFSDR